jgi:hypothetical protein
MAPALRALLARHADPDGKTNRDLVLEALLQAAVAGDVQAMKVIFERIDGKVPEPIEVTGAGGGPIVLTWIGTGVGDDADSE